MNHGAVLFREWITQYPVDETSLARHCFKSLLIQWKLPPRPQGLRIPSALDRLARATVDDEGISSNALKLQLSTGLNVIPHGGNRHGALQTCK